MNVRVLWYIVILPLIIATAGLAVLALVPAGSAHASPASDSAPSLPLCTYEDGSGQALCLWDASELGNGVGTDAVAGDCSYATVGSASNECLTLWAVGERTIYLTDGAVSVTSKGSVLVDDCLTIEFEASQDEAIREALNNDEWNLTECFKAHIE